MFTVKIKPLYAFQTLYRSPLSVLLYYRQRAASGSCTVSRELGEASVWLLWVGLLPVAPQQWQISWFTAVLAGGNERQAAYQHEGQCCIATQGVRAPKVLVI